jgi:hypothetical protein
VDLTKSVEVIYPDEEVVLLWGFVHRDLIPRVQQACAEYRLAYAEVNSLRQPSWITEFEGRPFVLECLSGEYTGALGVERYSREDPVIRRTRLTRWYKQRHREWSSRKIAQAVLHKLEHEARGPNITPHVRKRRDESVLATRSFLSAVARYGPVTLLLDDGGTMAVECGGTAGRPPSRRPRMAEAVECHIDGITAMLLLEFPYWVPVRVVA